MESDLQTGSPSALAPTIKDILALQSSWTWDIMERSAQLGEMIREDAITSVNLANINSFAAQHQIPLHTHSLQGAKLESEFGGDWMWIYGSRTLLIQAKRLDVVLSAGLMSYTIDIAQMIRLIESARMLSLNQKIDAEPFYVFYNSMIPGVSNKSLAGCTCVNAIKLLTYLKESGVQSDQKTCTIRWQALVRSPQELGAGSWLGMFP